MSARILLYFEAIYFFLLLVVQSSNCYEESNIYEYRQYFDIGAVPRDKTTVSEHKKHVVCVFNSWAFWRKRHGKFNITDNRHFDGRLCTHIVYRSILLNNETFDLKVKDEYLDITLGYFKLVVGLKSKYPDLKVLLSVGGYDEGNVTFPVLAAGRKSRAKFIRSATDTIKKYNFDGLNLNWEFPGDKTHFTALAEETKEEFNKSQLLLTTTISGDIDIIKRAYDVKKICSIFDLVMVMSFSYNGPWDYFTGHNAPLYDGGSVFETLRYLLYEAEADPQVLILGVPLYARPFIIRNPNIASSGLSSTAISGFQGPTTTQDDLWAYFEVCELIKSDRMYKSWKIYWDQTSTVPFLTNGSHWMSFDNADSIFAKVWLARNYNLKGVMAWTIDTDDFHGHCSRSSVNYPLLRIINYALQMDKPTDPKHLLPLCTLYNSTDNRQFMNAMKSRITSKMENISLTLPSYGDTIKFSCTAVGLPSPTIKFFKLNEMKITTEEEIFNYPKHKNDRNLSSDDAMASQTMRYYDCGPHKPVEVISEGIMFFNTHSIGHYYCEGDNIFGVDKKYFSVSEVDNDNDTDTYANGVSSQSNVPWGWIVGSFVVIVNLCLVAYYLRQRRNKKKEGLTKRELKHFYRGMTNKRRGSPAGNIYQEDGQTSSDCIPYDTSYEIFQRHFEIEEKNILGNGAFGIVFLGYVNESPVAVKSTKEGAEKQYLIALLSELKILIHLGKHPHIVNLIGASTINLNKGLLYIFVEYCRLGNLHKYLRNKCRGYLISLIKEDMLDPSLFPEELTENMITTKDLLKWSYQVAQAMEYLEVKKVIHGDLAARNVLLFQKDLVKVTDFGLSRKLYNYSNYVKNKQEPLPWRWMAMESLRDLEFSHQSDVWSFGVTIWEIFSLGETPYAGTSWTTDFVDSLSDNLRIHKPKYSTSSLYNFMENCWKENPQDRPKPSDLTHYFRDLLKLFSEGYETIDIVN